MAVVADGSVRRLALGRLISNTGSLAATTALAFTIYERTGSLYPVIALHAFNNMIAYMVGTEAYALSAALGAAMIAACVLVPRLAWRTAPALP